MSEYSPTEYGYLHVLRHTFQPSESLASKIGELLISGARPDFLLRATKEAYVDSWMYAHDRYRHEMSDVHEGFRSDIRLPFVLGNIAMKETVQRTHISEDETREVRKVRLALLPVDAARFDKMVGHLDIFPDMYPRLEPARHYLYMDFNRLSMKRDGEFDEGRTLQEAVHELAVEMQQRAERGLYSATVKEVTGAELRLPLEALRPGWRSRASDEPVAL